MTFTIEKGNSMTINNGIVMSGIVGGMTFLVIVLSCVAWKLRQMHRRDKIMQRLLRYTHDAPIIMKMGK